MRKPSLTSFADHLLPSGWQAADDRQCYQLKKFTRRVDRFPSPHVVPEGLLNKMRLCGDVVLALHEGGLCAAIRV